MTFVLKDKIHYATHIRTETTNLVDKWNNHQLMMRSDLKGAIEHK